MIPLLLLLTAAAQQDDALVLPISGANRMLLIAEEWEASGDHEKAERAYRGIALTDPADDGAALQQLAHDTVMPYMQTWWAEAEAEAGVEARA